MRHRRDLCRTIPSDPKRKLGAPTNRRRDRRYAVPQVFVLHLSVAQIWLSKYEQHRQVGCLPEGGVELGGKIKLTRVNLKLN